AGGPCERDDAGVDLEEPIRVAGSAVRRDRSGPEADRSDPHRRAVGLERGDDLAQRTRTVVVAQRLAGVGPAEGLPTVDGRARVEDVEIRRRSGDTIHTVEAAVDPDGARRADARPHTA